MGLAAVLLASCAVGPDYQQPPAYLVDDYRGVAGADAAVAWKVGEPADAVPKGEWWKVFGDPTLDRLQRMARDNNQSVQAAIARIDSARSTARQARAQFYPRLTTEPSYERRRDSDETNFGTFGTNPFDEFSIPFDLSYEVDLWGRVRRQVESDVREAEATVADFENLLLSLQGELAQNYFNLIALNREVEIIKKTLTTRQERLDLIAKRAQLGESSDLDTFRAESDLKTTEAQLSTIRLQRAQLINAIATLVGEPASTFEMPAVADALPPPPVIPVGLPSSLLERRPDIAAAERRLAARNAEIGVAKAAFFPQIRLTGEFGFASSDFSNLFSLSSRVWSYGPSIFVPIFQFGRLTSELQRSESEYVAAVAEFRQEVLVGFQEVEDALVGLEYLGQRFQAEKEASAAAKEAERLSQLRYDSGVVDYLEALDAQRTALELERSVVRTRGQQLVTAVALVEALGGGW